jgi:ferredoxin-nitrite reductase
MSEAKAKLTNEERIKKEKHPLSLRPDIDKWAIEGFSSIPEDDYIRFKWFGCYLQKPKTDGYFMMRMRIPGGQINVKQGRAIADITKEFARNEIDVTTRQCFQVHWLTIQTIPIIIDKLKSVGLDVLGACGDITRNITGNPLAGIDPTEYVDATQLINRYVKEIAERPDLGDLPRKFKVSISGAPHNLAQPEINCIGIIGAEKDGKKGYTIRVGGGLSTNPFFSKWLNVFLKDDDEVLKVCAAVTELYRDFGNRENRRKARVKFLMDDWGPVKFREEIEKKIGYKLTDYPNPKLVEINSDALGVNKMKQEGFNFIGVPIKVGRLSGEDLHKLCDIAEKYGNGLLRNTNKQNILILGIPDQKVNEALAALKETGIYSETHTNNRIISCTGSQYCNLAIVETKNRTVKMIDYLEKKSVNVNNINIHFSGCPNSCSQYSIADIGFIGGKTKGENDQMEEAYILHLGGSIGNNPSFTRSTVKVKADECGVIVEKLINYYHSNKKTDESFRDFYQNYEKEQIGELLGIATAKTE